MPLDLVTSAATDSNPTIIKRLSVPERIGLTPVPTDIAIQHRNTVTANFRASLSHLSPTMLRARMRLCQWRMLQPNPAEIPSRQMTGLSRLVFRLVAVGRNEVILNGRIGEGIPPDVMALGKEVQARMRKQHVAHHLAVQVFDTDPLMWLHYQDGNDINLCCLAIWDITTSGSIIHHIADMT